MEQVLAARPTVPAGRRARLAAYGGVLLAFLDNFALLPLIGPRAQELGADALGVGLAVAAYSIANLALNVLGGALADRTGRRTVLLVSLAATPICIALYAVADTLPAFLAVRVIHGAIGGALVVSLFAVLADMAPEGRRGAVIGRAGALIGLAAVIGPALAGVAARELGTQVVFLGLAGVIAAGLLLVGGSLPETLPATRRAAAPGTWRRLLSDRRLRVAFVGIFALEAAVGIVTGFLKDGIQARQVLEGMDAERALRYATGAQGGLFSIFAIIAIVLMLSPLARRVDRRGATGIVAAGLVAIAASTTVLAVSGSLGADVAGMALYGVGFGLVFPAATAIVGIATRPEERGRAYGLYNVAFDLGLATGPLLAGLASSAAGVAPFVVATTLATGAAILVPALGRGTGQPAEPGRATAA